MQTYYYTSLVFGLHTAPSGGNIGVEQCAILKCMNMKVNLEEEEKLKHTSNCVNKCSNLCRLKTVSVSNFKLESG